MAHFNDTQLQQALDPIKSRFGSELVNLDKHIRALHEKVTNESVECPCNYIQKKTSLRRNN
jgi:hypothetical protein